MKNFYLIFAILFSIFFSFTSSGENPIHGYIFIAEECPISIFMVSELQKIEDEFGNDCQLTLVFPMKKSSRESAEKFVVEYGLSAYKILLDPKQEMAKSLGATITPELVLINSQNNQIQYRGRINDAFFAPGRKKHGRLIRDAQTAISHAINGEEVPKPWHEAVGCLITFHQ